jgi:phospholipid/cholesterol/gamma-HCH transport system substrate-binding protein/paraquat-inducible protein B
MVEETEQEANRHYRLGLFVLVGLVGMAALLFVLGGRKLFERTYTFETYFAGSVAGLEVGSPLRFRGIPLGSVTQIQSSSSLYEPDVPIGTRHSYVVVRAKVNLDKAAIQVERDRPEMIRLGLRVQTQLAGISGQQYLALDYLDPAKYPPLPFNWTPEYDYVPSAPSAAAQIVAGAQDLMAKLSEVDVKRLASNLDTLIGKLDDAVDRLQVAELSADARRVLRTANTRLADQRLGQAVDNLASVSASLRAMTERKDLDRLVQRLDEAAARLGGLIADNQYDAKQIVEDLRLTAENLRVLTATIKRYPAGALLGGPPEKVQLPAEPPQ